MHQPILFGISKVCLGDRKSNDISVHTCLIEDSGNISKRFLHSLRSVAIDKVAEANAKAMTATSIEMRRILTDRQSFGRFGA